MAKQPEVITFKIDKQLSNLMKGIENRSAFIRTALLAALDNLCPFCKGTGVLTPHRKEHWQDFSKSHVLENCGECDGVISAREPHK